MIKREAAVATSLAMVMMGVCAGFGQNGGRGGSSNERTRDTSISQPEQSIQQQRDMPIGEVPRFGERVEAYRRQAELKEKQKKFLADSQKMEALATEVKLVAALPPSDKALAEMAKKAAQIEKLAHGVAARLKDDH